MRVCDKRARVKVLTLCKFLLAMSSSIEVALKARGSRQDSGSIVEIAGVVRAVTGSTLFSTGDEVGEINIMFRFISNTPTRVSGWLRSTTRLTPARASTLYLCMHV